MSIEFSRDLITGRIAEVVFEQMMRDMGGYTVIPFGYEHTVPTLTQYRHLAQIPEIIDNIADAPDFVLISEDKTKIFMVEVKYRSTLNREELLKHAHELCKRWKCPWLFIATPDGFFCSMCEHIIEENTIKPLSENWASKDMQEAYLKLLNEFQRRG